MEQDHCLGADGDDRRDGVRDPGEPARPPEGTGEAVYLAARRRSRPRAAAAAQPAAAGPEPIEPLLANADPKQGRAARQGLCRNATPSTKAAPNKIGPNLWDITEENDRQRPELPVLRRRWQAHKGEKWDPDKLNVWLCKPQAFAKGTKMTFAGFPKAQDRADVIAYLRIRLK